MIIECCHKWRLRTEEMLCRRPYQRNVKYHILLDAHRNALFHSKMPQKNHFYCKALIEMVLKANKLHLLASRSVYIRSISLLKMTACLE